MNLRVFIFVVAASASVYGACQRGTAISKRISCKRAARSVVEGEGSKVRYKLFTPKFSFEGIVVTANNSSLLTYGGFDPSLRTIVIVHGWLSNQRPSFYGVRLKDAIFQDAQLTSQYFNIILVDWSPIDTILYWTAARKVPVVGYQNARLLRLIMDTFGYGADNFHIIGHSLGAHIAAETVRALGSKEPVITGLDPAGPLFGADNHLRLTAKDSRNVVVIYTCAGYLSLGDSVGHTNIYPQGGKWAQPGCMPDITGVCSHCRATLIQAEIIHNKGIQAQRCTSYTAFRNGECNGERVELIYNLFPSETPKGDFYFWSHPTSPFSPSSNAAVNLEWQDVASKEGC